MHRSVDVARACREFSLELWEKYSRFIAAFGHKIKIKSAPFEAALSKWVCEPALILAVSPVGKGIKLFSSLI
jgi:hypothetical protein